MNNFDDTYFKTRLSERKERLIVWQQIAKYLQRYVHGRVLDLGCGHADFLRYIKADEKIGVDVHRSPHLPSDVFFMESSCTDFRAVDIDVVFASNLLEHLSDADLDATIESVKAELKPGGLFILIQPNYKYCYKTYFDDYTHQKIFTDISLVDYLKSKGFSTVLVKPKFLPTSIKSHLPKNNFLTWLYLHSPWKPFAGQMLIVMKK